MNTSKSAFDQLCEKIASGQATPEEIQQAFKLLNQDIDSFDTDIQKQLTELKDNL